MCVCVQIATDVLNKLPNMFELDKIRKKFGFEISPTTVVLLQEIERFNILIKRMNRSLVTLKRVSLSLPYIITRRNRPLCRHSQTRSLSLSQRHHQNEPLCRRSQTSRSFT